MDEQATERTTQYDDRSHQLSERDSNVGSMMRRRPGRAALIGAGLAVAVGLLQARRRSNSARNDSQYGWSGQEAGMAHRGAQGTREAKKQTLITWLNDAHAMEKSLVQTLKNYIHDAKDHPVMRARLEGHLEETREHAHLVRDCIERLGGRVSTIKSSLSAVMGTMQGVATTPAKDELVKNILAGSAAERLEIASYRGIITAADEIGDTETARVCRQILHEEEAMSEWLEQQLPSAVREQMAHA